MSPMNPTRCLTRLPLPMLLALAASAAADPTDHALEDQLAAEAAQFAPAFVAPASLQAADPAGSGSWGAVIPWTPHIPVTAASLPDGRLLTFASNQRTTFPGGPEFTYAAVWNPATGVFTEINNTRHDMFCGGTAMLPDGRVVINGGRNTTVLSSIFDYRTNQWVAMPNMNDPRWYNTSVALTDGTVFTVSGSGGSNTAERWEESTGWRRLTGINWTAVTSQPGYINIWHPFMAVAPNGMLFHFGPTQRMDWVSADGTGSLSDSGQRIPGTHYPKEGAWAIYEAGKILIAGGGANTTNNPSDTTTGTSTTNAFTIDLNGPTPVVAPAQPMQFARQFANSVVLPSGEVMIIGGNSSGLKFNDTGSILTPELWNPRTGTWRTLANMTVPRNYHSVALLLPDGRVWSGGGGLGGNSADHRDAQIFTPPALLNTDGSPAVRPALDTAPPKIGLGSTFTVTGTAGLAKFAFIKMSAITHSVNTDLRYLELAFTEPAAGSYSLTAHANLNVMTPGYWMLFGIDPNGVYSVSKVIQVDATTGVSLAQPGNRTSVTGAPASLQLFGSGPAGVTLTYSATGLPPGLTLNPDSGLITGTPTAVASYNVQVTVTGGASSASQNFVWTISPAKITQTFANFPNAGGLTLNSAAAVAAPALRLTGNTANAGGSAYLTGAIPIGPDTSFVTRFVFRQHGTADGADGMAFVIQGNSANAIGALGGGLAYNGVANSLAIEIDSYAGPGDPNANHIGVLANGDTVNHLATYVPGFDLENAASHTVWVDYDGVANTLRVYLSEAVTTVRPALPVLTLNAVDLAALTGANAWFGFTGATGGLTNNHDIESWTLSVNALGPFTVPVITNPGNLTTTAGDLVSRQIQASDADGDLLTFSASGLPGGLAIASATGLVTGTPNTPGSYNVTITVNDGMSPPVSTSFLWTINPGITLQPLSGPIAAAGSTVSLTGQAVGGVNPEFSWNFGDGTPDSPWSSSPATTHTFAAPGRYIVTLTVRDSTGRVVTASFRQGISAPLTALPPRASSSIALQTPAAGNARLWVANPDSDTVTVFDAVTLAKLAETAVAASPRTVAVAPDGRVWVVSADGAAISILNSSTFAITQTIPLSRGSRPYGLVFDPAGAHAWLTLENTGLVLRLDPSTGATTASINAGLDVRHLSVNADGSRVYVSRFVTPPLPGEDTAVVVTANQGGQVLVIDTAALAIERTILLQHSSEPDTTISGKGIPNYLGAPVLSPDGLSAWVPSKQDNITRGVLRNGLGLTHENSVRAIASRIDIASQAEDYSSRVDFDNAGVPGAACFDPSGIYAFVAIEASRAIAVIDVWNAVEVVRFPAGRAPQGLTISPDGRTLYVQNFMDRTVTLHDVSAILAGGEAPAPTIATLNAVATEKLTAQVLLGKQLFYDAKDNRLALQEYLSCAACHNDGGQDGRVWDFTGVGEGLRNTIVLNGHGAHGAQHWTGNFDEVQDFENQIRNFAGGTGLIASGTPNPPLGAPNAGRSADLDALAAYVGSLTKSGASPARTDNATLPPAAIAGRTVFKMQNCASCHSGTQFTNSALNVFRNVGTITQPGSGQRIGGPLPGFDVPTLRGLWGTGPYLHDGSAATIGDAIRAHSGVTLGDADLENLAAYVSNIDDFVVSAPSRLTLALSTPSTTVSGAFTVTATFSGPAAGFTLSDIGVTNGTASNLAGSGASYSFTITPGVPGGVSISIAAGLVLDTDGDPGLASNSLALVYQSVNLAPTITAIGNQTSVRGQSASLQVQASDPEGQAISYSASGLPLGLSINATGLISGTVSAGAAATNSVTVTVSDGSRSSSVSFTWNTTAPPTLSLTGRDIGSPGLSGSNSVSGGVHTVTASGTDIWGTSDKFRLVSQTFTGDGEMIVRVTSQTNTNGWAKAGIMFRESLNANSRHVMMVLTPSNGIAFQYRAATGGSSSHISGGASSAAPNNWLRLVRRGNVFTGYRSSDGHNWTQVGTATVSMAAAANAGLCVTSHNNSSRSTAKFDNLQIKP